MKMFQGRSAYYSRVILFAVGFFSLSLYLTAGWGVLWAKPSAQDFLMACYLGTAEEVKKGIEAGADVNAVSPQGHTPLTAAVLGQTNSLKKVEMLLAAKADPTIKGPGKYNHTPLLYALSNRHNLSLIKLLLRAETEINSEGRNTPVSISLLNVCLFSTAWPDQEQASLLKEFLNHGADINQKTKNGETALHQCARRSGPESLKVLLKAGADVDVVENIDGNTALHVAALQNSYPESIILLLDHGANPTKLNKHNQTPLKQAQHAIRRPGVPQIQAILHNPESRHQWKISDPPTIDDVVLLSHKGTAEELKRAIEVSSVDVNGLSKQGFTALVTAVASQVDNLEKVDLLLKAKANPNLQDKFGNTPLYKAVAEYRSNSLEVMERLIEAKADVNASSTIWKSLFTLAAGGAEAPGIKFFAMSDGYYPSWPPEQHARLLKFLLEKGADVDEDALIMASVQSGPESLRVLIEAGLDVNKIDDWRDLSALLIAAESNPYPESIQVLLEAGADPNFTCSPKNQCNALHLAKRNNNVAAERIKEILREAINKSNK